MLLLLGLIAAAPASAAVYASIQASVYLRAGPMIDYPVVLLLHPGSRVYVHGCLSDYRWCDISYAGERGWVYAEYLDYPYGGRLVPLIQYGPQIGIAILSFSILDYWGNHYRHRPWYRHREEYRRRYGPHGYRRERARPPVYRRAPPRAVPRREQRRPAPVRPRANPPQQRRQTPSNIQRRSNERSRIQQRNTERSRAQQRNIQRQQAPRQAPRANQQRRSNQGQNQNRRRQQQNGP